MAGVQGLTRAQIAQQVARNCLGAEYVTAAPTLAGDTLRLIDNKLHGGSQDHAGRWLWYTPSAATPEETRVKTFEANSNLLNLYPALSVSTATTGAYEMLSDRLSRTMINNAINQALDEVAGEFYPPEESLALHTDGKSLRYDVPSEFKRLRHVYYRRSVTSVQIDACDSGWTQQSNVTQAFDTTRKWQGSGSLRLVVDAAATAAASIASKTITALDMSTYDTLEFWILSSRALAASDLEVRLTSGATTISWQVPAITANIPTYVRVAGQPDFQRQLTAVVTVAVRQIVDIGATTLWFDDIKAAVNDSAVWRPVSSRAWSLDKDTGDLVFTQEGMESIGYSLLKLVGGDAPLLLTADSDVNEVDDLFVIYRATELAFRSRAMDKSEYGQQAFSFGQMAQARRRHLHRLRGSRKVS